MSYICPRCLERDPAMVHTCTPSNAWRNLEAERDKYREALTLIHLHWMGEDGEINPGYMANLARAALDKEQKPSGENHTVGSELIEGLGDG